MAAGPSTHASNTASPPPLPSQVAMPTPTPTPGVKNIIDNTGMTMTTPTASALVTPANAPRQRQRTTPAPKQVTKRVLFATPEKAPPPPPETQQSRDSKLSMALALSRLAPKDVAVAACVCRVWRSAASYVLTHTAGATLDISDVPARRRAIGVLQALSVRSSPLAHLSLCCPRPNKDPFEQPQPHQCASIYSAIAENANTTQHLTRLHLTAEQSTYAFPNASIFDFCAFDAATTTSASAAAINISLQNADNAQLIHLVSVSCKLRTLTIDSWAAATNCGTRLRISSATLHDLAIAEMTDVDDLALNCPSLRNLSLDFDDQPAFACPWDQSSHESGFAESELPTARPTTMMRQLAESVTMSPSLERLHVRLQSLGDQAVSALCSSGEIVALRTLEIVHATRLTDAGAAMLVRCCPNITTLDLSGCTLLTDDILTTITDDEKLAKNLVTLRLAGCTNLSMRAVSAAVPRLAALETLDLGYVFVDDRRTVKVSGPASSAPLSAAWFMQGREMTAVAAGAGAGGDWDDDDEEDKAQRRSNRLRHKSPVASPIAPRVAPVVYRVSMPVSPNKVLSPLRAGASAGSVLKRERALSPMRPVKVARVSEVDTVGGLGPDALKIVHPRLVVISLWGCSRVRSLSVEECSSLKEVCLNGCARLSFDRLHLPRGADGKTTSSVVVLSNGMGETVATKTEVGL